MESTDRYLEVFESLRRSKRWGTDVNILRFAALGLASMDVAHLRDPGGQLEAVADELKRRSGLFSPVRSVVRYVLAAMILRRGLKPADVLRWTAAAKVGLKERGVKRSSMHLTLAAFLMAVRQGGTVPRERFDRMREILARWREDHPFLTGADDYAMAALHAWRDESPDEIGHRVERVYKALHRAGLRRGNALQLASHVVCLSDRSAAECARRFEAVRSAFRSRGERIGTRRYDEVALLSLAGDAPGKIATRVLGFRDRLREARPRPSSEIAFGIACGLVLAGQAEAGTTGDAAALAAAQAILEAQTAVIAAASAAAAAAAASG